MFKFFYLLSILIILSSCNSYHGELTGVKNRTNWYQEDPFGMQFIPLGAFHMGPSDQDLPSTQYAQTKVVSIQSFYMDQTEITNNEYRQFTNYVRDSIAHRIIGEEHILDEAEYTERINWKKNIDWEDLEVQEIISELFIPENERFYKRKEIDSRRLLFEYWWIDTLIHFVGFMITLILLMNQ
jgi:sulfatase modifying factor 1